MITELITSFGFSGLMIVLAIMLGMVNNRQLEKIRDRIDNIELDQIEQAVRLVESGALEQAQLLEMIKRKRDRDGDSSGALTKILEGLI